MPRTHTIHLSPAEVKDLTFGWLNAVAADHDSTVAIDHRDGWHIVTVPRKTEAISLATRISAQLSAHRGVPTFVPSFTR